MHLIQLFKKTDLRLKQEPLIIKPILYIGIETFVSL